MNTVYFSIYLGLLCILSSASCSFEHTSPIHVLLYLHLNISFWAIVNGIVYLILTSICSLLIYTNTIYLCMLILYPATLLNLLISFRNCFVVPWNFLYTPSCHHQMGTVLFLPFQFYAFHFLFMPDTTG